MFYAHLLPWFCIRNRMYAACQTAPVHAFSPPGNSCKGLAFSISSVLSPKTQRCLTPQFFSVGSLRTQGEGLDTALSSVIHRGTSKQIHVSQINKDGTYDMKCQCLRLPYLSYSLQKHFPDMHIWPYHDPAMHGGRIASNSLMSLSGSCGQVKMILLEIGKETTSH